MNLMQHGVVLNPVSEIF